MSDDSFVAHRSLLFTVAYEMLGSATDAEDVVQETWLRWASVDQASVRDPRAYLLRIVTRQALNMLRTLARQREDYVGQWLPEPLLTSPDVAEDVELAESLSIAMLAVLETLAPTERAVFVLREVFDTPYDEIAEAVGKSPAAVRQVAHRARQRVAARRPPMQVNPGVHEQTLGQLVDAIRAGDIEALMDVLAPDVVMISDGGGIAAALPRPVEGARKVASALLGVGRVRFSTTSMRVNGAPALLLEITGEASTVVTTTMSAGRITGIYAIRNPHKLGRIADEAPLSR